ncbi:hypothetical protein ACFE04_018394 [Oxalis oulophora]
MFLFCISKQISIQEPDQQGMWGSLDIFEEVISQDKVDSPQKLALDNSNKGNGINADENMVSIDPHYPKVGSSSKMNGLNVDKAPSSCPIESRLVNKDRGVEPTTLVFGSSSVKDKRSARKERAATPTRSSVCSQAAERHVWLKLLHVEKL